MDQRSTDLLMVHWSPLYPLLQYLTFIWHLSFIPWILPSNPHCPQLCSFKSIGCCDIGLLYKIQIYTLIYTAKESYIIYYTDTQHAAQIHTEKYTAQNSILNTSVLSSLMLVTVICWCLVLRRSSLLVGFGLVLRSPPANCIMLGLLISFSETWFPVGLWPVHRPFPQSRHWENKTWEIRGLSSNQPLRFHLYMPLGDCGDDEQLSIYNHTCHIFVKILFKEQFCCAFMNYKYLKFVTNIYDFHL